MVLGFIVRLHTIILRSFYMLSRTSVDKIINVSRGFIYNIEDT